jgi:hypothetical protein
MPGNGSEAAQRLREPPVSPEQRSRNSRKGPSQRHRLVRRVPSNKRRRSPCPLRSFHLRPEALRQGTHRCVEQVSYSDGQGVAVQGRAHRWTTGMPIRHAAREDRLLRRGDRWRLQGCPGGAPGKHVPFLVDAENEPFVRHSGFISGPVRPQPLLWACQPCFAAQRAAC